MERASRKATAALYQHPGGIELRVTVEPVTPGERVLHSHVEQFNFASLQQDATAVRNTLRAEGWSEILER